MSTSPKRLRTDLKVIQEEPSLPYAGTPESKSRVNKLQGADSEESPTRVEPTPIRMGVVRKSLANFARNVVPPSMGKAAPPALPTIGYLAKSKAPNLPPPVKKPSVPPGQAPRPSSALPQLRPLFWHTFPPPTDRTCVWDDVEVSVSGLSDLVLQAEDRLVSLFAYTHRPGTSGLANVSSKGNENSAPKNPMNASNTAVVVMHGKRLMKVLDDRKTQNLAIAFRKFPEPEAVMEAIVSVDTTKLSGEQVALLLQEFPSPDLCTEIERVENSHPEEEDHLFEWDRPEQYLLVLACIHNCKHILTVWSFAVNHHAKVEGDCGGEYELMSSQNMSSGSTVRHQLTDFIAACDAVCNSTALRSFLAVLRQVGNRMNYNTPRGNARGVALESILQFDDVKSAGQGSVSLLGVVVEIWLSRSSEDTVSELNNQLRHIKKLRIPSIQEMEIDINKQNELARKASDSLKMYYQELEDESSMMIADKLKALSDPVLKQIKGNLDLLQRAKNSWTKCLGYFCVKGDSALCKNSNDFFDHWKKTLKLVEKYAAVTTSK